MRYAIALLLLLSACTAPVTMVNPQTGQTAQCGPYASGGSTGINTAFREAKCIDDFRSQGFMRQP